MKKILLWLFPNTINSIIIDYLKRQDDIEYERWLENNELAKDDYISELEYLEQLEQQSEEEILEELNEQEHLNDPINPCKEGDRVHVKSFNGIYTVVESGVENFTITCQKWQTLNRQPKKLAWSEFKCLVG